MLGEKKPQKSFFDMAAEQRVSNHFLLKIDRLIDWKPLQKELSKLYHPSLGRPSDPLSWFREMWDSKGGLRSLKAHPLRWQAWLRGAIEDPLALQPQKAHPQSRRPSH